MFLVLNVHVLIWTTLMIKYFTANGTQPKIFNTGTIPVTLRYYSKAAFFNVFPESKSMLKSESRWLEMFLFLI